MRLPEKIRVGTRGSRLALMQADLWIAQVQKRYPQISCEKVILKSTGDKVPEAPLSSFGGRGVFVAEFEEAILNGTIDYAVHSAKDMPARLHEGLDIVCVLEREDVRDVLITRKGNPVEKGKCAVIGTGSLRRQVQIAKQYENVRFFNLRGNVGTRLEKLRAGYFDAVILAAAGLKRLRLDKEEDLEYTYFDIDKIVPAGGQAVIAIEGKSGDAQEFLQNISDKKTAVELDTERRILKELDAGCHEAVGVYAKVSGMPGKTGYAVPSCLMPRNKISLNSRPQIEITAMKEIEGRVGFKYVKGTMEKRDLLIEEIIRELMTPKKSCLEV